jgi:hypothetical protein
VHKAITTDAASNFEHQGMSTTATVAKLSADGTKVAYANVGDSGLFILRKSTGQLERITKTDTTLSLIIDDLKAGKPNYLAEEFKMDLKFAEHLSWLIDNAAEGYDLQLYPDGTPLSEEHRALTENIFGLRPDLDSPMHLLLARNGILSSLGHLDPKGRPLDIQPDSGVVDLEPGDEVWILGDGVTDPMSLGMIADDLHVAGDLNMEQKSKWLVKSARRNFEVTRPSFIRNKDKNDDDITALGIAAEYKPVKETPNLLGRLRGYRKDIATTLAAAALTTALGVGAKEVFMNDSDAAAVSGAKVSDRPPVTPKTPTDHVEPVAEVKKTAPPAPSEVSTRASLHTHHKHSRHTKRKPKK